MSVAKRNAEYKFKTIGDQLSVKSYYFNEIVIVMIDIDMYICEENQL